MEVVRIAAGDDVAVAAVDELVADVVGAGANSA